MAARFLMLSRDRVAHQEQRAKPIPRVVARARPHVRRTKETPEMSEMGHVSLSRDQVRAIKETVTHGASYAERISLGFALAVFQLGQEFAEDHHILHEVDVLEGVALHSVTKEATQFRPPLHPLWHKHFSTPRHLMRNIGERWGLMRSGNRDLTAMIEKVASEHGSQPDLWPMRLVHQLVPGGLDQRVEAQRMTGDWIIFAKHDEQNFYVGLATHEEATRDPHRLLERLRQSNAREFPFLFE